MMTNEPRRKSLEALILLSDDVEFAGSFKDCSTVLSDIQKLKPTLVLMDIEIIMQTVFEDEG